MLSSSSNTRMGTEVSAPGRAVRSRSLSVLHVYTDHRGRGGAERFAEVNMQICRERNYRVGLFTRTSHDLPPGLQGRFQAGIGAIYESRSLAAFAAELDSFQPDVVHLYDYFPLISPWIAPLCVKRGIPIVMHCVHYRLTCPVATHFSHGECCTRCTGGREYWAVLRNCRGSLTESITVAAHNALMRISRPLTDHVSRFIAPSEFTRRWLVEHSGVEARRIASVMPFVDIPQTGIDASRGEYIAFAGRFAEEKGIQVFLDAAKLSGLPCRFCRNQDHAVRVQLPEGVSEVVTGNRAELDAFYRGARMLVFPSIWFETFGLVGAEAMSHGLPVIAPNFGALADLVEDEISGLLFRTGDAADLAAKMTRMWNDGDLCRRMGFAARKRAIANWTVDRYFEQLDSLYDEVILEMRKRS